MADAPTPEAHRGREELPPEGSAADEDFLYHLYRGSELLMQDRVVEAKNELERALVLQPQDAKSQDLLAGVYFRLGVYPRAIEIWKRLVEAYPRDATLRVNLSLALLKTGQAAAAAEHVNEALKQKPDHHKAWGYLGLVHWRAGRYEEARDAFLRGGQAAMARRMEDVLGTASSPGTTHAPPPHDADAGRSRQAMRSAAEQAIARFEAEQVPLTVEPQGQAHGGGAWRVGEPGAEATPSEVRAAPALPPEAPKPLAALLGDWSVGGDAPLALSPTGALHVRASTGVHCRLSGLRAVRGELRTTPVQRRSRGRDLPELLGAGDPILKWHGDTAAIVDPPEGSTFHGLTLAGELLFVRESVVWAFDDSLSFESGRVPLPDGELSLVQLHGEGAVILALPRAPSALHVTEGEEVRIVPDALVGWTGRLLPRGPRAQGTEPYSAHAPPLAFRGEGIVLVT